jgi:glycerol-3-phosphate O-acyltransferase
MDRYHLASFPPVLKVADMISGVLGSEGVRTAIRDEAEKGLNGSRSEEQAEARATAIAQRMFAGDSTEVFLGFAVFLRKLWRRLYDALRVDTTHMDRIREMSKKGPVVLLPTHRSYLDFLIVSFVCFCCKLPLPFIASGEDFLGILFVRYIFRQSRAFFLRRSFLGGDDALYSAIFKQYVSSVLEDGQSIEFFIEGTHTPTHTHAHISSHA